jgi:hypothetical protein
MRHATKAGQLGWNGARRADGVLITLPASEASCLHQEKRQRRQPGFGARRLSRSLVAVVCSVVTVVTVVTACRPTGVYDGGAERDGGPPPETVSLLSIGEPCFYDPVSGENPSNQCARGLECVMVSPDGRINPLALALPAFEDHFTVVFADGSAEGVCSLVGSAQTPPVCPQGATVKFFRSLVAPGGFSAMCVRPCTSSAECGATRVCDNRFMDVSLGAVGAGLCVKSCTFDVPDCTFSGVFVVPAQDGQTAVSLVDSDSLSGAAVCNRVTGLCEATRSRGTGDEGTPCATSADCAAGAACLQDELFPRDRDDGGFGFCATRCLLAEDGTHGCGPGSVCQPGLALGFEGEPLSGGGIIQQDSRTGQISVTNGLCFTQCSIGNDIACEPVAGTRCDAVDGAVMGAASLDASMCLPAEIALEPQ